MKPNNWNNCESAAAIGRSPKILIDNGHGVETSGKRTPPGLSGLPRFGKSKRFRKFACLRENYG